MTISRLEFDKLKQQVQALLVELDPLGNRGEILVEGADIKVGQLSAISANMGSLTAGTITGGTVQTAASGARVVMDSTGIKWYDATLQRGQILNDGSGWLGTSTAFSWTTAGVVSIDGAKLQGLSVPNAALAGGITATKLSVAQLSAISADIGTITAGSISGTTISQAAGGVVIDANGITVKGQYLIFKNSDGVLRGYVTGATAANLMIYGAAGIGIGLSAGEGIWMAPAGTVRLDIASDAIRVYGIPVQPSANNVVDLGTSLLKWRNIYTVLITTGDLLFENDFKVTEDGPDSLVFESPEGQPIMRLDREGNLWLKGSLRRRSHGQEKEALQGSAHRC